jgi:hypothetical protein
MCTIENNIDIPLPLPNRRGRGGQFSVFMYVCICYCERLFETVMARFYFSDWENGIVEIIESSLTGPFVLFNCVCVCGWVSVCS